VFNNESLGLNSRWFHPKLRAMFLQNKWEEEIIICDDKVDVFHDKTVKVDRSESG
jgi:hypothetical protein